MIVVVVDNNAVDVVFLVDDMQPVNGFRLMQVLRKNIPWGNERLFAQAPISCAIRGCGNTA